MNIQIDQSNRIEELTRDSIVAFSNKETRAIILPVAEKRKLHDFFHSIGKPQMFMYKVFSYMCVLAVYDYIQNIEQITIDNEYPGWEHLIKDLIIREIRRLKGNFSARQIAFVSIGKKSPAHRLAYEVHIGKKKAYRTVLYKDIVKFLIK